MTSTILLTTQDCLADHTISQTLGIVRGNTVRSRNIARNMLGGLRTIFGGEVPEWTKILAETREQASDRMIEHAKELGADAIVCVRFITAEIGQSTSEVMAYGTAVKLAPKHL